MLHGQYTTPPGIVQDFFSFDAIVCTTYLALLWINGSDNCPSSSLSIRKDDREKADQEAFGIEVYGRFWAVPAALEALLRGSYCDRACTGL
jgi:hypothetical protein